MTEMNKVLIALRGASRNVADTWRDITFAGIVRIPFPAGAPASQETLVDYELDKTGTFFRPVRDKLRPDSAPPRL